MLDREWDQWAGSHADVFGLTTEADIKMLTAWRPVFEGAGYTIPELVEATAWIAAHAPPKFRSDHLPALVDRITTRRRQLAVRDDPGVLEPSPCDWHCSRGWVTVPSLRCVSGERWHPPFAESAVLCKCPQGQRVASTLLDSKEVWRSMRLVDYEVRNPLWFQQLSQHRRYRRAKARAATAGHDADPKDFKTLKIDAALDEVLARCRSYVRQPGDEL